MEQSIRWECDHDLYFQLIDLPVMMKYVPVTVVRHNIPDPSERASMTTTLSEIERRLMQLWYSSAPHASPGIRPSARTRDRTRDTH